MKLFDNEIATMLFLEGKMPEWFYRQHYKNARENYTETHYKIKEWLLEKSNQIPMMENYIDKYVQQITIDLFKKK